VISSRGLTATLFAAALLAFLLPFGTVSCGEPVTFTGLELATGTVHGEDDSIVADLNSQGRPLALIAGISALVGGALAVAGRRGQGSAALIGLLALALMPLRALLQPLGAPDFTVRVGYVTACGSLAALVGIRSRLLLRGLGEDVRRTKRVEMALAALALFLVATALVCLTQSLSFEAS